MMDKNNLRTLEGTIVAIFKDELLFVNQINLSKEALAKTAEEWLASDYMADIYRLTGIESDVCIGTEIQISFAITTMSIPPLAPVVKYEVKTPVDDAVTIENHLRTMEGTIVAVSEEELLFVKQLNLSKEALKKTAEEWLASDYMMDIYRLVGIESDVSIGTEIRVSFAIATASIPPLAPIVEYEVITPVEADEINIENHLRTLEGTVIAISEEEILFVKQLNLSKEALSKTVKEWFASDHMIDIYRLVGIESDVSIGTEIRISFAITTMSIPPLAPVVKYEIIAPVEEKDAITNEEHLRVLEGTIVEILEDEVLFVAQLNLSKAELSKTFDEWLASDRQSDVYRLTGIESDVSIGTQLRISFAITTMSIPPLAPVVSYEIIAPDSDHKKA